MKTTTERDREVPVGDASAESANNSNLPEKEPEQMWTMEDAFDWDGGGDLKSAGLDLERGIRSVAFLLHYLSDAGNETIDGYVAQGLGRCLNFCAKQASDLRELNILRRNGEINY
jgi:hypothetical protein